MAGPHMFLLCAFTFASLTGSSAADLFYQSPFGASPGNTYALEPFALAQLHAPSCRYQQVYGASDFAGLPQGGTISEIIFRADEIFGRPSLSVFDMQFILSVTPRGPDALSLNFSENKGIHERTIYQGRLAPGSDPRIVLQNPYPYNPAEGNLLLEILNFSQVFMPSDPQWEMGPLDAEDRLGDTVSRIFAYDVNAASGIADSIGLVTFFRVTPIPEPSTMALISLAAGAFGGWWLRRKPLGKER